MTAPEERNKRVARALDDISCKHPYGVASRDRETGRPFCGDCGDWLPEIGPDRRTPRTPDSRPGIPVQVRHAPINTQNWQITADMVKRFNSGRKGFQDPCVICGVIFNKCPHTAGETVIVWNMIKNMTNTEKYRILNGE